MGRSTADLSGWLDTGRGRSPRRAIEGSTPHRTAVRIKCMERLASPIIGSDLDLRLGL